MLCHIARRSISKAEDGGTKPPRWVERHAARCGSCREYARFAGSLKARLSDDREAFIATVPEFPVEEAAWGRPGDGRDKRVSQGHRLVLRPFPAAAAVLVVAAATLILFQVVLREPSPSAQDRAAVLAALKSIAAAPDELPGVVTGAESALDREREILERSIASAVEYLQTRLNIKVERRQSPKSL